jgi:hypothetical protein
LAKDPAHRYSTVGQMLACLPPPPQARPGESPVLPTMRSSGEGVPPPLPPASDEEPIMRTVRQTAGEVRKWWRDSQLNTPVKIIILVAVVFGLLITSGTWLPLTFAAVMAYGVYMIVRALIKPARHTPAPTTVFTPPAAPVAGPRPLSGAMRARGLPVMAAARQNALQALIVKPTRQRIAELLGSLMSSSLVSATMCLVMVILMSYGGNLPRPEEVAWLFLTSLAGTWAVLTVSKFWEGTQGEQSLRRFTMLVVGLGVGLAAAEIATFLTVRPLGEAAFLSAQREWPAPGYHLPADFYTLNGSPLLMAHLACFGTLFLVLRWWRQADPLRSTRLSVWTMLVCTALGGLVAAGWHFPQPWLMMLAATMSVAIQLCSPWTPPMPRTRR